MRRILLCLGVSLLIGVAFVEIVDLTPKVEESFFFSEHDPQLRSDNAIQRMFPESAQVILAATGDVRSPAYAARVRALSDELGRLPGVQSVQSLSNGPKDLEDAVKSPLWTRLLLSENGKSSYIYVTFGRSPGDATIRRLEDIRRRFDERGFGVAISGVPYVTSLIGRNLSQDLRVFSLAAACVFSVMLFVIFRSPWILLGMLVACIDSGAATLIASHLVRIPIGPLTANLSTMVFVMTLSPIVFLTFNWKRIPGGASRDPIGARREAVERTIVPSFWSAVCMFLGFVSLLFVASTPMRHLGIAGAIGASMAFASAYGVYPWFLERARPPRTARRTAKRFESRASAFFAQRHGWMVAGLVVFTLTGAYGLLRLNTDPTLPSYFKKGGDIRTGLESIDRAGGSSPLKIVVEDQPRAPLNHKEQIERLWALQRSLEQDPAVGSVVSLPIVVGEARRPWYTFILSTERIIKILDKPEHGEVARRLISEDRTQALFLLRMRETGRDAPRRAVIGRLEHTVSRAGFRTVLVGGAYSLLDQTGQLVTSSLISGVLLLIGVFVVMGFAFSRSFRVAGAMLASLTVIPIIIRGYVAYLGMPLDFITASAANLDLGMGVDAMIYLTLLARREGDGRLDSWPAWSKACAHLWRPIGTSLVVICAGFGIFLLSNFPPTQRFGVFVMFGSATAAATALFMFPWLASSRRRTRDAAAD